MSLRTKPKTRRLLGVDPGYGRMGWAVIAVQKNHPRLVASGCLVTPTQAAATSRVATLYHELQKIITVWSPTEAAMEKLFFQRNTSTAVGVGQARGIALLALAENNLPVREFTPSDVKLSTTGYGRADKRQIGLMVKALLKLPRLPASDDEADAIAIALCAVTNRHNYVA